MFRKTFCLLYVFIFIVASAFSYINPANDKNSFFARFTAREKHLAEKEEKIDELNYVPKRQRNEMSFSGALVYGIERFDGKESLSGDLEKYAFDLLSLRLEFCSRPKSGFFYGLEVAGGIIASELEPDKNISGVGKGFGKIQAGVKGGYGIRFSNFDIDLSLGLGAGFYLGKSSVTNSDQILMVFEPKAGVSLRYMLSDSFAVKGGFEYVLPCNPSLLKSENISYESNFASCFCCNIFAGATYVIN